MAAFTCNICGAGFEGKGCNCDALPERSLSDKAKAFLAKQPTFIGTVSGYDFYEHPEMGDESPLLVVTPDGKVHKTYEWELPESPWSPALDFTTV